MKKLTRRDFLRFLGIAGAGVLASKIPVKDKPKVFHGKNATVTIDGNTIPMDMGGYTFDLPELEEEAIQALTVSKDIMFGRTITSIVPVYPGDNWFYGPRIRYFPDKDSDNCLEGEVVHVNPETGVVTAAFPGDEWTKLGIALESLDKET